MSFPGILHAGLSTTRRRPVLGRFPLWRPFGQTPAERPD